MTHHPVKPPEVSESDRAAARGWGIAGEVAKYTAVLAVMGVAIFFVKKKLTHITWDDFVNGLQTTPIDKILIALLVTAINFVILTGYDLIAVRYLKKELPLRKIMVGAVIGYSMSNIFGWIIGGTALRYRLYASWGFKLIEIVAFVSILSITFWLGMFLLAGIAFVLLPVRLPEQYREALHFSPHVYGYVFLAAVLVYLGITLVYRKPLKIGGQEFALPPFRLTILQLMVSAADFALASFVLYILLPDGTVNYSTVLVSYLAAMIVVVALHVPGGFGVLELIILELLADGTHPQATEQTIKVTCALVIFRVIYYFIPAIVSAFLLLNHEIQVRRERALEETTS